VTRIAPAVSIAEGLGDLFAAATNGRRPPLSLHAQMAAAPALLAAYVGIRRAIEEHGTLDHRSRSAIMLAVSTADRCEYAEAVNRVLATRAGSGPAEIDAIISGRATGDARLDSLLAVAREAAMDGGRVTGATWRAAIDAGLSESRLAEAYASIALSIFVDGFVNYADTPFDVPGPSRQAA
jgi:alkylhydroperoxidase/carboxymuconolactone decarboxylase family protein YurZ